MERTDVFQPCYGPFCWYFEVTCFTSTVDAPDGTKRFFFALLYPGVELFDFQLTITSKTEADPYLRHYR